MIRDSIRDFISSWKLEYGRDWKLIAQLQKCKHYSSRVGANNSGERGEIETEAREEMDPPFHLMNLITVIFFLSSQILLCDALTFPARRARPNTSTRRQWLSGSAVKVIISAAGIVAISSPTAAIAAPDEEYNNPNIPAGPEERCKRHLLL